MMSNNTAVHSDFPQMALRLPKFEAIEVQQSHFSLRCGVLGIHIAMILALVSLF